VLSVPHWLPMIRVYLLYSVGALSFVIRMLYWLIACAIMTASANVLAEDDSPTSCENEGFDNIYYLIDKNDFYPASIFYQKIDVIDSKTETDFKSLIGERERFTIYYDFDDLDILNADKELVYILDKDLLDFFPDREQINYIDIQTTPVNVNKFEVKKYNRKISPLDKHPLFSKVKRKQRSILVDLIADISKSPPEAISESLKIELSENVHFIILHGTNFGAITLSRFTISNFGVPNTSLLLKIEKFYNRQDYLIEHERKYLDAFFCQIEERFEMQFPHIKPSSWFGYRDYNQLAIDKLPSRAFFRKYPEIFSLGQIITLIFIGFLFIYLILGRYSKSDSYRKISRFYQK